MSTGAPLSLPLGGSLPPGAQAEIVAMTSPNFKHLNGECCAIVQNTGPGSALVILSSGQLLTLPSDSLQMVDMLAGDRVAIVDAYQQLDTRFRNQIGTIVQIDRALVVVQLKIGSSVEHVSVPIGNVVLVNPALQMGAGSQGLGNMQMPSSFRTASPGRGSSPRAGSSLRTSSPRGASRQPLGSPSSAGMNQAGSNQAPRLPSKSLGPPSVVSSYGSQTLGSLTPPAASSANQTPKASQLLGSVPLGSQSLGSQKLTVLSNQAKKSGVKFTPDVIDTEETIGRQTLRSNNSSRDGTYSISTMASSDAGDCWLEESRNGSATVVHAVCHKRRGLLFDIITRINDAGADVLEARREEDMDNKVSLAILVVGDSGGPIPRDEQQALQEAVMEVTHQTKHPTRYQMMRKQARRCKSREFTTTSDDPFVKKATRSKIRLLIIGPGFGPDFNQQHFAMVQQAGYEIMHKMCVDPNLKGFNIASQLGELKHVIDEFVPDCVLVASKGGAYMQALWQNRLWTGPSVVINAHPSLNIPPEVPVVVAHGSNDQFFSRSRHETEQLMNTGTKSMCFLYYTANSGQHPSGGYTRCGDEHVMDSLLRHDCLPRLIDAAIGKQTERMFMKSWQLQLPSDCAKAAKWLGLSPDELKARWTDDPPESQIYGGVPVCDVPTNSEEWNMVAALFRANPIEEPNHKYPDNPQTGPWQNTPILRIQRVQNSAQLDGGFAPYYEQIKISIEAQKVEFQKGIHTRWVFHGTAAIEDIALNPIAGFLPLASGARGGTLWGAGTYFARDAKYVARAGFAVNMPDGRTRRMFLCLLICGIPCLGDPDNRGILPLRQEQYHYNSCLDSLNNPEIFVAQLSRAAYPAYVITFV